MKRDKAKYLQWNQNNPRSKMDDLSRRKFIQAAGMFLGAMGAPIGMRHEVMEKISRRIFGSSLAFAQAASDTPIKFWYNISVRIAGKLDALVCPVSDKSSYGANNVNRDTHFDAASAISVADAGVPFTPALANAPTIFSPEMTNVANAFGDRFSYLLTQRNTAHVPAGSTISLMKTGQTNLAASFPVAFINQRSDISVDLATLFDYSKSWNITNLGPYSSGVPSKVGTVENLLKQFEKVDVVTGAGTVFNEDFARILAAVNDGFNSSVLKFIEEKNRTNFAQVMENVDTLISLDKRTQIEANLAAGQVISDGITKPSFGTAQFKSVNIDPFVAGRLAGNLAQQKACLGLNIEVDYGDPHLFVPDGSNDKAFGQTTRGSAIRAGGVASGRFFQTFSAYIASLLEDTLSYLDGIADPDIPANSILDRMLITITNDCTRGPDLEDSAAADTGPQDAFGGGVRENKDQNAQEIIMICPPDVFKNGSLTTMDSNFQYQGFNPSTLAFLTETNSVEDLRHSVADLLGINIEDAGGETGVSLIPRV